MTVSRVNLPPPIPAVEGKSDATPANPNDLHRSEHPAPQQEKPVRPPPPKGARGNLLANIKRAKTSGAQSKESIGTTWNAGFAVACELVEACGADELANRPLRHFEEMTEPLATQALMANDMIANAINWLRAGGLPGRENDNVAARDTLAPAEPNADLLMKLEGLKADNKDSNSLGFYAVMAVMSAMPKLAKLIRMYRDEDKIVYASAMVNKQVQEFTDGIEALLKNASPAPDNPLSKQLISMVRAAMKVPFEYMSGKGMITNLSISMDKWRQDVSGTEREASQSQLEKALHSFIDARIQLE